MPYNPKIHHRRSIRLKGYDYSRQGLYFITICCDKRRYLFGEIANGQMVLNEAGKFANECWKEIPDHFPNAVLHEYIIMPNHVHGIIELVTDETDGRGDNPVDTVGPDGPGGWTGPAGAENFLPQRKNEPKKHQFQKMIPRSIGSIVKGFKIGVTKWFRENTDIETVWQRNYHEHIIRNEISYHNISRYIINNPANWKEDKFFTQ